MMRATSHQYTGCTRPTQREERGGGSMPSLRCEARHGVGVPIQQLWRQLAGGQLVGVDKWRECQAAAQHTTPPDCRCPPRGKKTNTQEERLIISGSCQSTCSAPGPACSPPAPTHTAQVTNLRSPRLAHHHCVTCGSCWQTALAAAVVWRCLPSWQTRTT